MGTTRTTATWESAVPTRCSSSLISESVKRRNSIKHRGGERPRSEMSFDTPWNKARKQRSQEHERRVAGLPEGSQQPNSGRLWRWSRDAVVWNFLVEARTHERPDVNSYRISV